ncbi:hypothetical protein KM043_016268 [Ampulex compressa]|nr:hypothetical protein KM043_016268 [Ampulex compressa]
MQISLWKRCCHNEAYTKDKTLLGRAKDFEKEFLTAEENDEEHDDSVAVINHKDSLSILAEKYKVERNLKINKFPNEHETVKDTNKGGSKASLSHVVYDQEVDGIIDEKNSNVKEREKSADREVSKNVENARSYRHDCDQILKEGYNNRLKNLRSRLIKKDICCSAKGTPWRHTF